MAMAKAEGFAFIPGLVPYTKIGDTDISKTDLGDGEKTPPPKSPDKWLIITLYPLLPGTANNLARLFTWSLKHGSQS